jgi:hypothetical protein
MFRKGRYAMTAPFPFKQPAPPATFSMGDHIGEVVLAIMGGYHNAVPTKDYGVKPAASLTIVILTGRSAGVVVDDVMLFGKACSQFENAQPGDVVLCKIAKVGRANVFQPGSSYDEQLAQQWIAQTGRLDELRAKAPQNYTEQIKQLAEQARGNGSTSPQFVPPGATVTYTNPQPTPAQPPTYAPQPNAQPPTGQPYYPQHEPPPQTFGTPPPVDQPPF